MRMTVHSARLCGASPLGGAAAAVDSMALEQDRADAHRSAGLPLVIQEYFLQIRRIDECTAQDGAFIGHMLVNAVLSVKKSRRAEVAATFILRTEMLRDVPAANLSPLLRLLVCNQSRDLLAGDVATQDPAQLTAADACTIANGITTIRRGHVSTANAVAEVLDKYHALRTMVEQCVWFEPMLVAVLLSLMAASAETKLRLALSTALSMLDIGSDLSTVLVYFVTDQYFTGLLILAMVCFSIAAQSLLVFYRNMHSSAGEIAKEVLIVLSCFKPVIDLRRQMDGHEVDGAPFDTNTERNVCKVIETVCESVPASIIAMVALLLIGKEKWAWTPIVSIFVSWITTAFKATSVTFSMDTDRKRRKRNPRFARTTTTPTHHCVAAPLVVCENVQNSRLRRCEIVSANRFYGFVPSKPARRRIVYACLFVLILAHVVERTAALTLLFVTGKTWLGGVLGTEMGLYLLYTALRSDFIVWVPGMRFGGSLVYRAVSKLMVDFCGLPHLRHPMEVGGAYWLFLILANQAMCFMSVWAYTEHYDGAGKLDRAVLFPTFGLLAGVWAAAFTGFLLSIERTYLWTFMSLETGRESTVRFFNETHGDDESRTQIFNFNELLWGSIREKVAAWCQANYDRWKVKSPAWLTPGLLAKIPDDCLPKYHLLSEPSLVRRHRGVRGLDGDLD